MTAARDATEAPALEVRAAHRFGAFSLDVDFSAPAGVTALFGRSGAGKSTVANAVAGLIKPERGRIVVGGEILYDAEAGVFTPPHRRRIGYVFQDGRLFPHLTVRRNLLFGSRFAASETDAAPSLDRVVALLGLEALLERRPGRLSGGERQRVAIGRALLSRPRLLIMDEPLAALDAARKAEILPYLERLRDASAAPIIYVSHAMEEVARLATTLVALSDGRVARVGPTAEALADPTAFPMLGRQEAGALLAATVVAPDAGHGLTELAAGGGRLFLPALNLPVGARLRIRIRARDVLIADRRPKGLSALNMLDAFVISIGGGPDDAVVEVALDCAGERLLARITRRSLEALALRPGAPCVAVIKTIAVGRRDLGVFEDRAI